VYETGLLDLLTGSGRPRTPRSCVVQRGAVADWWYSWPMASTLASLCLSQRRTLWTCVVTISLFSLYLMNFMLHTMLDATDVVLRVHYKVWNVMYYFHEVAYVHYLGEVDIFHTRVNKFIPLTWPVVRIAPVFCNCIYSAHCCWVFAFMHNIHTLWNSLPNTVGFTSLAVLNICIRTVDFSEFLMCFMMFNLVT